MTTELRPELELLPENMKGLPVHRGFPVPWFVAFMPDGTPEFRAMDPEKWATAVKERLCWVCGKPRGYFADAFVLGPMCGITRTNSEPPSHRECAEWSARNCPFLSRPQMVRREEGLPEGHQMAGCPINRNAGVTLVWLTSKFSIFRDHNNLPLIRIGEPMRVSAWREGRRATREETNESVRTGLPILMAAAEEDGPEAVAELNRYIARFNRVLDTFIS